MSHLQRFLNKIVIITDSTSGIGQAAAIRFGQEGASLTIHGRNPEGMEEGVPEERILQIFGDTREEKTLKMLVEKTVDKFGGIDILVNNAGAPAEEMGLCKAELESLDEILEVILKSHIRLTAPLPFPIWKKGRGNVVNVSSVDGVKSHSESLNYSLAKKGIRINNLSPGYIDTNIKLRGGATKEGLKKFEETWIQRNVPLKRAGTRAEMANIIAFLASNEASLMTGSIVVADGGLQHFAESQKPCQQ